jgi:3-methyladenine DNA glycosylase AlkD
VIRGARELEAELIALGDPDDAAFLSRYFKTGPGEYGEGDRFLGIRVPALRRLARAHEDLPLGSVRSLLHSRWHEARLLALLILVRAYQRADRRNDRSTCAQIYRLYLANTEGVNNWDLADLSAPGIVGAHLLRNDRRRAAGAPTRLVGLARSRNVWRRRIAVLATLPFIRAGDYGPTLAIADLLLEDRHDLIHKAVGWMLREVGKRDRAVQERFLKPRYARMPRTMLRYAIEKFPASRRRGYLAGRI